MHLSIHLLKQTDARQRISFFSESNFLIRIFYEFWCWALCNYLRLDRYHCKLYIFNRLRFVYYQVVFINIDTRNTFCINWSIHHWPQWLFGIFSFLVITYLNWTKFKAMFWCTCWKCRFYLLIWLSRHKWTLKGTSYNL